VWGTATEMGPALLPTPLSPACGPLPKEACLTPGAWPQAGCGSLARRSRRCRMCRGAGCDPGDLSLALPAIRNRVRQPCHRERLRVCREAWRCRGWRDLRMVRPFASGDAQSDALSFVGDGPCGCFPLSYRLRSVLRHPRRPLRWGSSGQDRQAIPRFSASASAFDDWRMPLHTESGKTAAWHLSTFGRMASGQGWTSERFVANGADEWLNASDPAAPAGAAAGH
jgi:hypothetical protein